SGYETSWTQEKTVEQASAGASAWLAKKREAPSLLLVVLQADAAGPSSGARDDDGHGVTVKAAGDAPAALLSARAKDDPSVWVVFSDHGERTASSSRPPPSSPAQGILSDAALRIPLGVGAPGWTSAVSDRSCGPIDLLPTALDLLGLPARSDLEG